MVGNVTIQGQIVGTATFDGAKISAVVTIATPINATVVFGKSGVAIHNLLTGRDAVDAHPIEAITGLTEVLETIPTPLSFTPENVANKKTTLTNSETDYPSTSAVNRLTELKQTDSPEFANTQITTLQSDATGGIIPAAEATWLGATAKSVLSYLQKLVSKVYAINSRVAVLEDKIILDMTVPSPASSVVITLDKNGIPLSFGDLSEFEIDVAGGVAVGSPYLYLILNDTTNIYINATGNNFAFYGTAGVVFRQIFELFITTKAIFCKLNSIRATADYATVGIAVLPNSTRDNAISLPITRLELRTSSATLNAGTRIIIRKK